MTEVLTMRDARRIALAAQGLSKPRSTSLVGSSKQITATVRRLGLLQIDSVNVLSRAHYLPLFSRLGPYDKARLDALSWGQGRRFFEYWGHEASLIPLEDHPLFRWRMARADRGDGTWTGLKTFAGENRPAAMALLTRIRDYGPLSASDLEGGAGQKGWWAWSVGKAALEWLFWTGRITARERKPSFERVYDLTERVLPPKILACPTPLEADAHRTLLAKAAHALGIATAAQLRDYYRLPAAETGLRLRELLDAGDILPVRLSGETRPYFLSARVPAPGPGRAFALLAPFDPLVWERARTERLFDFRYRIEIYTPAQKRLYGYYVLPFLFNERLAARVDLKADRVKGCLLVRSAHGEPGKPEETAAALGAELRALAGWLGLNDVVVEGRGDLAPELSASIRRI